MFSRACTIRAPFNTTALSSLRSSYSMRYSDSIMSPLTLYSWPTPNGIKASIALEELGIEYKLEPINISINIQKEDWYLKINPNGRIPALADGDQRVFESGAILLYLAEKYDPERKISYAPGSPEYIEQVSWLMFQMGGLGPMMGQAEHFRLFANTRSDYGIKRYIDETKRLYSVLDSRLNESPYLAGSKYTIADIANWSWAQIGPAALELDLAEWPALNRWVEEIKGRGAVQRGLVLPNTGTSLQQMAERFREFRARIDALGNTDTN
ncbi:glutathione S-transferase [Aspergillus granulosus]|uniref:Glutathione S-transferase n=1 Tax=Aspergillus granulosus TaxID=176169 RepID=A0ABR4GVK6_9EURO